MKTTSMHQTEMEITTSQGMRLVVHQNIHIQTILQHVLPISAFVLTYFADEIVEGQDFLGGGRGERDVVNAK